MARKSGAQRWEGRTAASDEQLLSRSGRRAWRRVVRLCPTTAAVGHRRTL